MLEQFIERIELLLTIKLTMSNNKNRSTLVQQITVANWELPVAKHIKVEVQGV